MFDPLTGQLVWQVDTAGYELDSDAELVSPDDATLTARFYRSKLTDASYADRGTLRRRGGSLREYRPFEEAPGLARRLAAMYPFGAKSIVPTDNEIVEFTNAFGLLTHGDSMPVGTIVYTAKYLSVFASAVDNDRKHLAREVFNERVQPNVTAILAGSASVQPTANWSIEIEPVDLISTAWLQMAAELTHGKRLKKCAAPDYREWFPDRGNKKFCGNRCKMAFHRVERRSG